MSLPQYWTIQKERLKLLDILLSIRVPETPKA